MKRLSLVLLATLSLGGVALAEQPGASSNAPGQQMKQGDTTKMQGSPNAAGFDKNKAGASDMTGSTGPGSGAASATSSDSKAKK